MPDRRVLLALTLASVTVLAGCVGNKTTERVFKDDAANASASAPGAQVNATNASNTQGSNSSNQTYEYANCMAGMDMPGCPADVAERYYREQQAKARADKPLPPVKIALKPQGDGQTGAFSVENGTLQLLVTVYLNDTGQGPYFALGPGGMGDLRVDLKGGSVTKSVALSGSANSAGVDPAVVMTHAYNAIVTLPSDGDWTATVQGQGQNVQVTLSIVERFYT